MYRYQFIMLLALSVSFFVWLCVLLGPALALQHSCLCWTSNETCSKVSIWLDCKHLPKSNTDKRANKHPNQSQSQNSNPNPKHIHTRKVNKSFLSRFSMIECIWVNDHFDRLKSRWFCLFKFHCPINLSRSIKVSLALFLPSQPDQRRSRSLALFYIC